MGPLLFNIYLIDLCNIMSSTANLYLSNYAVHNNILILANEIESPMKHRDVVLRMMKQLDKTNF